MSARRFMLFLVMGCLLVAAACYAERPCYPVAAASAHTGNDICLTAHVYDIVAAPNGDRYLDVCPAGESEVACRFTVVSLAEDQEHVGSLAAIEGQDIRMRGTVRGSEAGSFMLLTNTGQLHGGAERFRPNPELMNGFGAGSGATAFKDPAMQGHHAHAASLFRGTAR